MDMNKSRTDLLAAGRKKLQQFRQKKDGKGSSSQGKKKATKCEQHESDVDAVLAATEPTALLLSEGESTSHIDSHLGAVYSKSMESSAAPEIDVPAGDLSLETITPESGIIETPPVQLQPQEPAASDVASLVPYEVESTQTVDAEEARAVPLATIDNTVLDRETKDTVMFVVADLPTPSRFIDTIEGGTLTFEMDNAYRKERLESLASHEMVLDTSLIQARGYQVTDVGAMQEADGSGLKQCDRSSEPELKGDGKSNLLELRGSDAILEESVSGATGVYETNPEEKSTSNADEVPASTGAANTSDGFSAAALDSHEADGILAMSHQVIDLLKDVVAGLHNEEKSEMCPVHGGNNSYEGVQADTVNLMVAEADNQRCMPEDSLMTDSKAQERSLKKEMVPSSEITASSVGDGHSISHLQLKEIAKVLSKDEFRSLLDSRGSVSNAVQGTGSLILPDYAVQDSFERLKEELYITNFMKDIFYLQVTEMSGLQMEFDHHYHQLVDELSLLQASPVKFKRREIA